MVCSFRGTGTCEPSTTCSQAGCWVWCSWQLTQGCYRCERADGTVAQARKARGQRQHAQLQCAVQVVVWRGGPHRPRRPPTPLGTHTPPADGHEPLPRAPAPGVTRHRAVRAPRSRQRWRAADSLCAPSLFAPADLFLRLFLSVSTENGAAGGGYAGTRGDGGGPPKLQRQYGRHRGVGGSAGGGLG